MTMPPTSDTSRPPWCSMSRLAQTQVPANPAYAFLGTPGAPVWILPQSETPRLLFLGLATAEVDAGVFVNNQLELRLLEVNGPGHFAVYAVDAFGQPVIHMNSGDGIGPDDRRRLTAGAHEHVNWAFTAPGLYRVKFQAFGTLVEGGAAVEGEEVEICFEVIGIEARLRFTVAGDEGTLSFVTQEGLIYQFQSAPTVNGPWDDFGQPFIGTGRERQIKVPLGAGARFFKLAAGLGR